MLFILGNCPKGVAKPPHPAQGPKGKRRRPFTFSGLVQLLVGPLKPAQPRHAGWIALTAEGSVKG